MKVLATKFTEESTLKGWHNGVPHDKPCVSVRFYAFTDDGRFAVDAAWPATFESVAEAFADKGVSVDPADLEQAFDAPVY